MIEHRTAEGIVPALFFTCPVCTGTKGGHGHLIAFHDGPSGRQPDGDVFWHRESGSTPADLTLSPSYLTECMHAYVRGGVLEVL